MLAFLEKHKEHKELNVNRLEKKGGLGEGTLRKFVDGKTQSLNTDTYDKIRLAASDILKRSVSLGELQGEDEPQKPPPPPPGTGAISAFTPADIVRDQSVTTLLVWRLVHSTSGQQGAFVLSSEAIMEIPRADLVAEAKKPFRCKLLDNANGPGYAAGHTIVVDPDPENGAAIGELCVFTDESKILSGGAPSIAAILKDFTATHWIVTQNKVAGDQELPRSIYPQAWPVTAHYPRGV